MNRTYHVIINKFLDIENRSRSSSTSSVTDTQSITPDGSSIADDDSEESQEVIDELMTIFDHAEALCRKLKVVYI